MGLVLTLLFAAVVVGVVYCLLKCKRKPISSSSEKQAGGESPAPQPPSPENTPTPQAPEPPEESGGDGTPQQ